MNGTVGMSAANVVAHQPALRAVYFNAMIEGELSYILQNKMQIRLPSVCSFKYMILLAVVNAIEM